jgi:putative endonuclease
VSDSANWSARFGLAAERHVAAMLRAAGLDVLECRYRTPDGEIDLVAREAGTLIFVEVKARRGADFGSAEEAVDWRKQRRLVAAARAYLCQVGHRGDSRFDVVAVESRAGRVSCRWIRDAFRP